MKLRLVLTIVFACALASARSTEFHVATNGCNADSGTSRKPLRTISAAAERAMPGDTITVHAGVYRERINPPRGGSSERRRIVYRVAPGERVEIRGSEIVTNWSAVSNDVWKVTLPNSFFGTFNPFTNIISGDWFWNRKGRVDHTGAVYLNDDWLTEANALEELFATQTAAAKNPLWYAQTDSHETTIWAQFPQVNPNQGNVEINVRQTVFFPEKTNVNYLTVRGFVLRNAATPWAPPTALQVGLIGTHWSKGWVIESNVISHSICSGVALGKYGDKWDNLAATADAYVNTLNRALTNGWSADHIGHHVVRGNTISHCEQAGIVGSLGAVFSTIEDNEIHDIHVRRLFGGAEMAGIKIHGAIDVRIRRNHIYRTVRGLWLDWMAQGTWVSQNLMHDNQQQDVFLEVDHGPFLFDNNILLSATSLGIQSQGGAFVHNLVAGEVRLSPADTRMTPYHKPHSTAVAGYHDNPHGDMRFYNNVFVQKANLGVYDSAVLPVVMEGNVYLPGANPSAREQNAVVSAADPQLSLLQYPGGGINGEPTFMLKFTPGPNWLGKQRRPSVTTRLLGKAVIPGQRFETPEGKSLQIDKDYFGRSRSRHPTPGPFEKVSDELVVWPQGR